MTWSSRGSSEKWGILLAHSTSANSCLSAVWQMLVTASWGWNQTIQYVYLVIHPRQIIPATIILGLKVVTEVILNPSCSCENTYKSLLTCYNDSQSCQQNHHPSGAQSSAPQQSLPLKSSPQASPRSLRHWTPALLHALGSSGVPPGPLCQTKHEETVVGGEKEWGDGKYWRMKRLWGKEKRQLVNVWVRVLLCKMLCITLGFMLHWVSPVLIWGYLKTGNHVSDGKKHSI